MTSGSTTTTTVYIAGLEEVTTSGSTTTTTCYYAGSQRIAEAVNGVFSYLGSDGLGSVEVALSASGSATASQLHSPYGSVRYCSGTMPTDYGVTGHHSDAAAGLDHNNAPCFGVPSGKDLVNLPPQANTLTWTHRNQPVRLQSDRCARRTPHAPYRRQSRCRPSLPEDRDE